MKIFKFILFSVSLFLLIGGYRNAKADGMSENITSSECPQDIPYPASYQVNCGFVRVPEDHANPNGKTIELAFAVVHTKNPTPQPDPLIILMGGPGASGMAYFLPQVEVNFASFLADRDLVIFDQRGVGYSRPSLTCPQVVPVLNNKLFEVMQGKATVEEYQQLVVDTVPDCWDFFQAQGYHPANYTTAQSAADVQVLGESLGYTKWNLYAISYGARIGLSILEDSPGEVRSIIFDSPLPFQVDAHNGALPDVYKNLSLLFERCEQHLVCRLFYPNLENTYLALYEQLNAKPYFMTYEDESTGNTQPVPVDGPVFATLLKGALNSASAWRYIPRLISDTAKGNYETLAAINLDPFFHSTKENFGLNLTVGCGEFVPYFSRSTQGDMTYSEAYTASRDYPVDFAYSVCESWGPVAIDPKVVEPVVSDTPVLVMVGSLDIRTPPAFARQMVRTLSHSTLVEVPERGHGEILTGECPTGIMVQFLNVQGESLDTSCLKALKEGSFLVSKTAIQPLALFALGFLAFVSVWISIRHLPPALQKRPKLAWRASIPGLAGILFPTTVIAIFLWLDAGLGYMDPFPYLQIPNLITTIIPLSIGIQAAMCFAPSQEPLLEIMLSLKRSTGWVVVERVLAVSVLQTAIALLGLWVASRLGGENLFTWKMILGWISPALFLTGLGVYLTLSTRQSAAGITITMILWFALMSTGEYLLERWPFLWPVALYPPLDGLNSTQYLINRGILALAGLNLFGWGLLRLGDVEQVFLGAVKGEQSGDRTKKPSRFTTPWRQRPLGGVIRYEMLMIWRQRYIWMMFGIMGIILLVMGLRGRITMAADLQALANSISPEVAREKITSSVITALIPVTGILALLLPGFVGDMVPKDESYGVGEILDSLPTNWYLRIFGKLLAVWGTVLVGVGSLYLLTRFGTVLLIGEIDPSEFTRAFVLGGLPQTLYTTGMTMLLASAQTSRRKGVLLGIGFTLFYGVIIPLFTRGNLVDALLANPFMFMFSFMDVPGVQLYQPKDLIIAILSMVLQLFVVGIGMSVWRRHRES